MALGPPTSSSSSERCRTSSRPTSTSDSKRRCALLGTSILRRLDVRRRHEVRRRHDFARWQQALIAAVGSVVVLGAAFAVSRSPLFAARNIDVHAARGGKLSERQVLHIARVGADTNVLWLSTASVASRLEASPWISS